MTSPSGQHVIKSLGPGSSWQTYKIQFAVCTHAGSLAAGRLTQFPCSTASCSCTVAAVLAACRASRWYPTVGCVSRRETGERETCLSTEVRARKRERKLSFFLWLEKWTHAGPPRSLQSPRSAALPPPGCESPGAAEVVRWPPVAGTGQGCSSLCAAPCSESSPPGE